MHENKNEKYRVHKIDRKSLTDMGIQLKAQLILGVTKPFLIVAGHPCNYGNEPEKDAETIKQSQFNLLSR